MPEKVIMILDCIRVLLAVCLIVVALVGGPFWLLMTLVVLVFIGLVWSAAREDGFFRARNDGY